jgi:hypothetical protein
MVYKVRFTCFMLEAAPSWNFKVMPARDTIAGYGIHGLEKEATINLNSISQGYREGQRFSAQRSTSQYGRRREDQRGRSCTDSSRCKALLALYVMVPCYLASALCSLKKAETCPFFQKNTAQAVHSTTTICAPSHVVGLDGSGELAR